MVHFFQCGTEFSVLFVGFEVARQNRKVVGYFIADYKTVGAEI